MEMDKDQSEYDIFVEEDRKIVLFSVIALGLVGFFATVLAYAMQPVVLEPAELSGSPGSWIPFRYPTDKFPRFCFFRSIMGTNDWSCGSLKMGKMERGLWFQVPENQTQVEVIYQCNSFYNTSVLVTITPEKMPVESYQRPIYIALSLIATILLGSVMFKLMRMTLSHLTNQSKLKRRREFLSL